MPCNVTSANRLIFFYQLMMVSERFIKVVEYANYGCHWRILVNFIKQQKHNFRSDAETSTCLLNLFFPPQITAQH